MKITITGTAKEGKSTIARFIQTCLADAGLASAVFDEPLSPMWFDHNGKRMKALQLKQEQAISIEVKNVKENDD
jgi:hypothetical protein